jgi:hypothetical protein
LPFLLARGPEENVSPKKGSGSGQATPPIIRVAPLGELNAYVVYEHELDALAAGSPATLTLNFSIGLLSAAVTLGVALATTTITSDRTFTSFVIVLVISILAGIFFLLFWWRTHQSTRDLVGKIKDRMPPTPGVQDLAGITPAGREPEPAPPQTEAGPSG